MKTIIKGRHAEKYGAVLWSSFQCLDKHKCMWRHGRAWLYGRGWNLGTEWKLFSNSCRLSFAVNDWDDDITLGFSIPLFAIWLYITGIFPQKWKCKDARELKLFIADWSIFWNIWTDPYVTLNHWREGSFNFLDLLFGRSAYTKKTLKEIDVVIRMPEKDYQGHAKVFLSTWKRPRWPWPRKLVRTAIDVKEGIPIPGKGENSWDIGDDAIYSLTTEKATTIPGVVNRLVLDAIETRLKRSGTPNWEK